MMSTNLREPTMDGVIHLDVEGTIADPGLRLMAACVRDLRPLILAYGRRHGQGMTMAALITIVANQAIACGDTNLIADAFRQNADMLDPKIGAKAVERQPQRAAKPWSTENHGTAF